MILVLKMLGDKTLVITKYGNIYCGENNAETIKIILPKIINSSNVKDCHIYLNYSNQQDVGDICDVTAYLQEYSEDYYFVEIPMYQMFTYESGKVWMWIKILHSSTEMIIKTNEVVFEIKPHKDIEEIIPEKKMSVIDGLVTNLEAVTNKVDEIAEYTDELSKGVVLLVEPSDETEQSEE